MENINNFFSNTIDNNKGISIYDKESIKLVINQFINLFNRFGVDVPIGNCSQLLSDLKVVNNYNSDLTEFAYCYDSESNTIINNKKYVKDENRRLYDYCFSILSIISRRFDVETSRYSDGLVYTDEKNATYGYKINDKLKHRLVGLLTGEVIDQEEISDFYVDKADDPCTLEDCLLIDINSFVLDVDLLNYFINADGISFYQKICSSLDDEEKAKDFMKNIDAYTKENSIENRKKYDEVISMLKEKKVTDENSKRIA